MSATSASQSVEAAIKSRLESPVVGTVLLSFIVTNWQILILLTTGENCAKCRIDEVAAYWTRTPLSVSVGVPVLISGFYLGVLPFILEWYENFPRLLRLKKDIKDKIAETDAREVVKYKKSLAELLLKMRVEHDKGLEAAKSVLNIYTNQGKSAAHIPLQQHIESLQNISTQLHRLNFSDVSLISQSDALSRFEHDLNRVRAALYPSRAKKSE